MNYLKNHCWCSDSIWGGVYDCPIIVSVTAYTTYDKNDFALLTEKHLFFSQTVYERNQQLFNTKPHHTDEYHRELATREVDFVRPEVVDWLAKNIPDMSNGSPAWAVGSDEYQAQSNDSVSFFFQRRRDAMKFIKHWSEWKRPVHYTQYFTDVRKKLNLETMRYEQE